LILPFLNYRYCEHIAVAAVIFVAVVSVHAVVPKISAGKNRIILNHGGVFVAAIRNQHGEQSH